MQEGNALAPLTFFAPDGGAKARLVQAKLKGAAGENFSVSAGATTFPPKLVLVIRHAEKTGRPEDRGLSETGRSRAAALAETLPRTFGPLDALIACRSTAKSRRPAETLEPVAQRLGLPIDERWGTYDFADLARTVLTDPALAGRAVLISWRHDTMKQLAESFGVAEAPAWPDTLYDGIWKLEPSPTGVELTQQPQGLEISAEITSHR